METAGLAGAVVVTATMGPGGTATASMGETARGSEPMMLGATGAVTAASGMVATAKAVGALAGSKGTRPGGELGAQSVLHGRQALVTWAPALPPPSCKHCRDPSSPQPPVRPSRRPPPAGSAHWRLPIPLCSPWAPSAPGHPSGAPSSPHSSVDHVT